MCLLHCARRATNLADELLQLEHLPYWAHVHSTAWSHMSAESPNDSLGLTLHLNTADALSTSANLLSFTPIGASQPAGMAVFVS